MKKYASIFFQLSLTFLWMSNLQAQKAVKGSSADNPWTKETLEGTRIFNYRNPVSGLYTDLDFGNWSFSAAYTYPHRKNETADANPGRFEIYACCYNYNIRHALLFYQDSVQASATAPGNIHFRIFFSSEDSVFEQYLKNFSTITDLHRYHFFKKIRGYVYVAARDSFSFQLGIWFNDSLTQPISLISAGTDTIWMNPVFVKKLKAREKESASGSNYDGFEFYRNNKLVGSARRKLDWALVPKYHYWFSNQLALKDQEAIASMIFLIAGFIR